MLATFWHILEFVSGSLATPSETNWTEKACHILSEESVFASCRKPMPLHGGRVKSHAFKCSCTYPIRKVDVHPKLVLLSHDLCSFASAKQFCTVLVFKHRTSASTWKQKLEWIIKLWKPPFATNFPTIFLFVTHVGVLFHVWAQCDITKLLVI